MAMKPIEVPAVYAKRLDEYRNGVGRSAMVDPARPPEPSAA